jgi:hypothetical protein
VQPALESVPAEHIPLAVCDESVLMKLDRLAVEAALRTIQKSLDREVGAEELLSAIRILSLYLQKVEQENTRLRTRS